MTESAPETSENKSASSTQNTDWRRPAIIMAVVMLIACAMFAVSFTFPTLESGYLTVSLITLILAFFAFRHWGIESVDSESSQTQLFACFFALLLSVICLFDGMNWSLLGDKRDGETGFIIGLIFSFFICVKSTRRIFPKPKDRTSALFSILFIAATIILVGMQTFSGNGIAGAKGICACILTLIILPEVWHVSGQVSPGWRLVLHTGAAFMTISGLTDGIYPSYLSGKISVWLLWCLSCIASRRGVEPQTPETGILERMLLGAGIFVFSVDGLSLIPGTSLEYFAVPVSLIASMPLLLFLWRLNGNCSVLLCWLALIVVGISAGCAVYSAENLPYPSQFLAKFIIPIVLLTIAIRHIRLRYKSGIRPIFISGASAFPQTSFRSAIRSSIVAIAIWVLSAGFIMPTWMLVLNVSPSKLLSGLHGTPLWPGLPLFVTLAMHDEYYFYDKVPWRWPVSDDANAVIENLWHNPPDRFSYYDTESLMDEINQYMPGKGKNTDARLNFRHDKDKITGLYRISIIMPGSPLEKAGIRRGDILLAVDHKPVKPGRICNKIGQKVLLSIRNKSGDESDVEVSCVAAAPFRPFHRVIATESEPVGYLYLNGFTLNEYSGIDLHIIQLRKSGIRKLVLDLRNNGGGRVVNEKDLDSKLLGKKFAGVVSGRTLYNQKYQDRNEEEKLPSSITGNLSLTKLVVLTGKETCSASEAVINNLKPFLSVQTVGAATCGKPMMMEKIPIGDNDKGTRLSLVTALNENSSGVGGYFKGIPPDCAAVDDLNHDLGDPRERLLKEALYLLETGRCSANGQ